MSLSTRVDRLETAVLRRDCPENHFAVHISRVGLDGAETADPELGPCGACGGALDVQEIVIATVPDRGE